MRKLKLFFACLLMAVLSIGQVWAETATYTVSTASEVTETGDIPDGSSAALTGNAGLNGGMLQLTYGKNAVLTLSGYAGCTITGFKMSMKSNSSKGKGSMTLVAGETTLHSVPDAAFNSSDWYGAWSTSAVDVDFTSVMTTDYTVGENEDIVITVTNHGTSNTTNSLYIGSYTITYTPGGVTPPSTPSVTVSPTSYDFGTVHASDAASKVFSVSGSNLEAGNLTLTVPTGFSVSPSSIAVDGTLAATEVTVSKNTSDIDDYDGNLEITGGGLENAKTVALTMTVDADPEPTGTFELFSGDIEEGDYVLVGYQTSSSKYYAMNSTVTSNQYLGITEVSIDANDQIVNPDASLVWTIEQSTNGYYIKQGSAYLDDNATSNKNYAQTVAEPTTTSEWTFAYDNTWTITNYGTETTKKTLSFNISASRVACYTAIQSGNTCFYLYKKVDGTVLPSAGLAFDAAQKLAKVAGTLTAPNLSTADGFDGTVTYASSDEAVVKVNASTGAITEIVAAGKAVITAHSDETENFREGSASYTIFVAEQAGTNEDPLTESSAKALIDLGCTLNAHVAGVVASQDGGNFTVTLTNGFKFYKAKDIGNVAFESAYLKINDEVTAYGQLTKYSSTYELAEGCYLTNYVEYTEPLTPIANDKDHPYTVAQALAFAAAPATYDITEAIYIAGVVYKVDNFSSTNGTLNIYVKDAGVENQFEFYKCKGIYDESLTAFTAEDDVQVGDEVIGYGVMKHFTNATTDIWEFDDTKTGDYLVSLNRPAVAVTGVTVESTASVAVGGTVTLHAAVVPENASNKTINWSVQSGNAYASVADGVVTGIAEGTAVIRAASDEDASIYAECTVTVAPLSPWASVYTSNVAMAHTGSGVDNGTITIGTDDPYLLVKAGASSSTGTIVVTVPKGTTDLHFHAFAWGGKTAKIELAGVENASVSEFDLAGEAGASGSGNDFTLQGDPVDQYFHVSFDAVAAETEITFSKATGSADNRFFFYGVNQEGGLILESISVSGTATALEYNEGDHFSPAGLGVTGHYSDASTAPITEGIVWAFDPDPLTEGTESVSVTATAGGFTSAAFVVDGLTVAGAAPLSPWATTWTSNLDDITGSKVKFYGEETEYAALKAGSSGTAGSATLNIPAQATELHLHAYGWNSEDVTLSITAPAGVTVTPASITLNRNSGFASNSPFTLAEGSTPQTDAYYALSLSGNTDAIELTITATEGKRFLLFGVNQVGGVVPVLQGIAISGDLDNKSYKAGQALDMTGLTVTATYKLGDAEPYNVDITSDPGLSWTYDPLVENQEEVTVTAHFEEETANKTITGLTVTSADPKIYVSTLNVNFASVEVGESVPAAETVTVTLTNVASVTATLGGTNADAFSVSPASLTESGDITISILANTDAAASYAATLTISDGEGGADDKTVNLSFEVTEPVTPEDPEVRKTWDLSIASYDANPTEEQVTWSATYVNMVVDKYNATTKANNYLGGDANNRTSSRFYQNSKLTITPNGKEITSVVFTATSTSYANALQGSEWTNASASVDGTTVTVTPTDGKNAIIAVVGGTCGFTAVQVNYKNIAPTPATPDYTREVTAGRYGTICLPNGGTISGAKLFDLEYYDGANTLYLLEVNGNAMVAGRPYIFLPSATTIEVFYTDDAGEDAGSYNGLVGSYTQETVTADADNYILYNNAYYLVNSTAYVGANRAYIHMADVPTESSTPQVGQAPRRRVAMAVNGKQTTTGCELINAAEAPAKMMINGQIFILRGEKMYDTTGRLVK